MENTGFSMALETRVAPMSNSDELEQEIRGLFNKSIEQVSGQDEVTHAYHIANRQRGIWDVAMMIGVGAMSVVRVLLAPGTPLSQSNNNKNTNGDEVNE
jgi:DNA-binding phage protein